MDLFEINLTAVIQLMSFLFLLWMLKKLLYNPFFSMIEKRRQKIEGELAEAEKIRKEAEKMRKEAEKILAEATQRAQGIISKAEAEAEQIVETAKQKARIEAEKIKQEALMDIERQKQEVLQQIQNVATELAVNLAMKILKGTLDEKAKREYLIKFLREHER
ncbi:F0F1 ATP synthase subunit B [Fervidobacterium thailandense]|uniref:ATP synthase subunit b n=1 Tax=Fervidobacterium thailandense TaxID=1008305 RepID=A0A1E3G0L5_9BACT|nr:F0F1 ATP synthase subunit B [Fervidobacterium thailandense]ODN29765.1 F0F1 ATP synthase subunit B [Fervidobacterium thailandense]